MTSSPEPKVVASALIAMLAERWPRCFAIAKQERQPLRVGIADELSAALDGVATSAEIGNALRHYTREKAYAAKLQAGAVRIGLDGEPTGPPVTYDAAVHATGRVAGMRTRSKARRKALRAIQRVKDAAWRLREKRRRKAAKLAARGAKAASGQGGKGSAQPRQTSQRGRQAGAVGRMDQPAITGRAQSTVFRPVKTKFQRVTVVPAPADRPRLGLGDLRAAAAARRASTPTEGENAT